MTDSVVVETDGPVTIVTINRPHARNAVDRDTAGRLYDAFVAFDADDSQHAAVLTGAEGNFCAGADLKKVAEGASGGRRRVDDEGPMGPTRLLLNKPVIAAVEGFAVAGGIELAVWCDLRVAAESATFGVYCRRWGVPLIDGGTIRLPRLIGQSHALDMILTGRGVGAEEALRIGLANRVVPEGEALASAVALANELAALPPVCLRADRRSVFEQWGLELDDAISREYAGGIAVIRSGETQAGAQRFASGAGRHGESV
ncbi:MAG TPA: crotonase/enoyl-CoA hydratase family protein [Acidimicrobiales bacterium]|nr:crotonase/enoyl-CoA hydratase family protein [Acidimicrobiales bacterium]